MERPTLLFRCVNCLALQECDLCDAIVAMAQAHVPDALVVMYCDACRAEGVGDETLEHSQQPSLEDKEEEDSYGARETVERSTGGSGTHH